MADPRKLLPILGLIVAGCAPAADIPSIVTAGIETTVPTTPVSTSVPVTSSSSVPAATTTTTLLAVETLAPGETLAALSEEALEVYSEPGAALPSATLDAHTVLGTPRVVQVLEGPRTDGWMRVALPTRPNGSEGWIEREAVTLFVVDRRVEIDLDQRSLAVIRNGAVEIETTVAIGGPDSPTPIGRFFITDSVILTDPTGPWGPHAFGLSAHSDTVTEFNGGDGIIGIHGTNRPGSIGQAQSLGCVRVPNEVALTLAGLLSAGIPVEIHP